MKIPARSIVKRQLFFSFYLIFSEEPFAHFISHGIIRRISLQKLFAIWPSVSIQGSLFYFH